MSEGYVTCPKCDSFIGDLDELCICPICGYSFLSET